MKDWMWIAPAAVVMGLAALWCWWPREMVKEKPWQMRAADEQELERAVRGLEAANREVLAATPPVMVADPKPRRRRTVGQVKKLHRLKKRARKAATKRKR